MSELAQQMTPDEARRATERIRVALDRVSTAWADLSERIADAYQRRADRALGYKSWAEYAEAELKPSGAIAAEVRRELVAKLAAQGMTTRAIAPTVGVSHMTAKRDADAGVTPCYTSPAPEVIGRETGEVITPDELPESAYYVPDFEDEPEPEPEPVKVTGLDGKTYPRTAGAKPTRRKLSVAADDIAWALRRDAERAQRIIADDRYKNNEQEVTRVMRSHLMFVVETCQEILDQMPTQ